MSLSLEVVDTVAGRPAHGVRVQWDVLRNGEWAAVAHGATDHDGRLDGWVEKETEVATHRLVFLTGEWMRGLGRETAFPEVVLHIAVHEADEHHGVGVLLGPFGYSAYRRT